MVTRMSARRRSLRASVVVLALVAAVALPLTPIGASATLAAATDHSPQPESAEPSQSASPIEAEPSDPSTDAASLTQPIPTEQPEAESVPIPAPSPSQTAPIGAGNYATLATGPEIMRGPFLFWNVSPAVAGASFKVQWRTQSILFGRLYGEPSPWIDTIVDDCASVDCVGVSDLDPDPGELQLQSIDGQAVRDDPLWGTALRYRITPLAAPAGYSWISDGPKAGSLSAIRGLGPFELKAMATVTLRAEVVDRVTPTDRFGLSISVAGSERATASTTGAALESIVGPVAIDAAPVVVAGKVVSGNANDYALSFTCADADRVAVPVTSGQVAMPSLFEADIVCTVKFTPLVTTVQVRVAVRDADGGNPQQAANWPVELTAQAQSGAVTLARTPGESGAAAWTVRHGSVAVVAEFTASVQMNGYSFVSAACVRNPLGAEPLASEPNTSSWVIEGVTPGSRIACDVVLRELPAELTLIQRLPFVGSANVDDFALAATGDPNQLPGPAGTSGVSARVTPGVAYTLSALGPDTYRSMGWSCTANDGVESIEVSAEGTVVVPPATGVTCASASGSGNLTLLAHIDPQFGGTLAASDFELTASPDPFGALSPTITPGSETVVESGQAANTLEVRPGLGYTLTATSRFAYLTLQLQRYTGDVPSDGAAFDDRKWEPVENAAAPVSVEVGEHEVYRFVAAAPPALTLPLTGGIGADSYLFGGAGVLLLGLLGAAVLLVRTRIRSSREARLM